MEPLESESLTQTTQPRTPIEVSERIIDFVAERTCTLWECYSGVQIWGDDVYETLYSCSLTCRAWRPRSQFHLLRIASVKASIEGSRSYGEMAALFRNTPRLKDGVEVVCVNGQDLAHPRLHLAPLKIPLLLPEIPSLRLMQGALCLPPGFDVCMRRFTSLVELCLEGILLCSVNDLRRVTESLRWLRSLAIVAPEWQKLGPHMVPRARPFPPSRIRLQHLEIKAEAEWILDPRTVHYLDWLSSSGAISIVEQIGLDNFVILNNTVLAAVDRMLWAAQASPYLRTVILDLGPELDLSCLYKTLNELPVLHKLCIICPYDTRIFLELANCLSVALDRNLESHEQLALCFTHYPHCNEPHAPSWQQLDNALQQVGLEYVFVHRIKYLEDPENPFVWGNLYPYEEAGDEWAAEAKALLPLTAAQGRLHCNSSSGFEVLIECKLAIPDSVVYHPDP